MNLSGGRTLDGGESVGASVFYNKKEGGDPDDPIEKLDKELSEGKRLVKQAELEEEKERSSRVWICTSTHAISKVTVIDANSPSDVLETFQVCSSHLLCIASVPGAKESDYRVDEELNKLIVEECEIKEEEAQLEKRINSNKDDVETDAGGGQPSDGIGTISFISCGNQEAAEAAAETVEPGNSCSLLFPPLFVAQKSLVAFIFEYFFVHISNFFFCSVSKPRLTRETAFELGTYLVFCFVSL